MATCFKENSTNVVIFSTLIKQRQKVAIFNITHHLAKQLSQKGIDVIPGWQLCRNCFQKARNEEENYEPAEACDETDYEITEFERDVTKEAARDVMNTSFAGPFLRIFPWGGGAFFEKGPFCEIIY